MLRLASIVAPFLPYAKLRQRFCVGVRFPVLDEALLLLGAGERQRLTDVNTLPRPNQRAIFGCENAPLVWDTSCPSGWKPSWTGYGELLLF